MNSGKEHGVSDVTDIADVVNAVTREQISRWMDGDIAPHEIELAMKTLTSDEARYCWAELHFVGDCVRGLEATRSGCAERIRSAIALEPTVIAPVAKTARVRAEVVQEKSLVASLREMGRGGRLWATAATVAAIGFVGTVVYQQQASPTQIAGNAQITGPATSVAVGSVVSAKAVPSADAFAKPSDFNALLQAHQESADASSMYAVRQYLRPAVAVQVGASDR
jgi:negative regulator of sigma E activity